MLFITGGVTSHKACAPGGSESKLKPDFGAETWPAGAPGYLPTARRLLAFYT